MATHWFPFQSRFARCGEFVSKRLQPITRDAHMVDCPECRKMLARFNAEMLERKDDVHDRVHMKIHGRLP